MTADLLAFLNARLDERRRELVGSGNLGWLTFLQPDGSMDHTEAACIDGDGTAIVAGQERTGYASSVVVHREDRELREIEAKRKRVAILAGMLEGPPTPEDGPEAAMAYRLDVARATALLHLEAAPFDQHPDFQEEWRLVASSADG